MSALNRQVLSDTTATPAMPYNTRRKSLSLSELGITVPKRHRAPSQSSLSTPLKTEIDGPPSKKTKSSHTPTAASPSPGAMSPPQTTNIRLKTGETRNNMRAVEHTPPPSPGAEGVSKIDTQGIKDDIVVGVIRQLEKTGNRPHTSKELAAVLANSVPTIDASTNPNALIQARLATYLKGPWPIVSPCPLGKQQENIHPRRVFYFLSTQPHQPIPEVSAQNPAIRRVISPSLSSAADEEAEEKYTRQRTQLSPSPEVDLSSPELEDASDVEIASVFSGRNSLPRDHPPTSTNLAHNRRADSPPLEREERDFKQTANELQQQRRDSQQQLEPAATAASMKTEQSEESGSIEMSIETTEHTEETAAAALFGNHEHLSVSAPTNFDLSSPVLKPLDAPMSLDSTTSPAKIPSHDAMSLDTTNNDEMDIWSAWDETGSLMSPENVELDELEGLFDF